jgi:hypothetical protein
MRSFVFCFPLFLLADPIPVIKTVDHQPLHAQALRVMESLDILGEPADDGFKRSVRGATDVEAIQRVLDPLCIAFVHINPEGRVHVAQGPVQAKLLQNGWRTFLVKVHNEAGTTAVLSVTSPNAGNLANNPAFGNAATNGENFAASGAYRRMWLDLRMYNKQPLKPHLGGLAVEYRVLQLFSRDAGKREAKLVFDTGAGSQDLGFRSEVDILFSAAPSTAIKLRVKDHDGRPTMASFEVRDTLDRIYPSPAKRLGGDFFFQKQVYREDGETILLPNGKFKFTYSRGPEYISQTREYTVDGVPREIEFQLQRWIDPSNLGPNRTRWYSGDHHIHAAGCAHYEKPTEGVYPKDMMRHVLGEDLKIGSVLTWGPGWYFQKTFFDGKDHALSTKDNLIHYDVEISGHPSSHTGHLMLLRLKEDEYRGIERIEDWPTWGMPILKWAKEQDAVVGYTHSGWGLPIKEEKLLSYEMPPFDSIGANEYIASVTHGLVDLISAVDTPYHWELNIWYHVLNAGYRTRISGETDFPCIYDERVGLGRSYVRQSALSYDDWIEGLRQGRNYVSDGRSHLIDFKVNGVEMGAGRDVNLAAPSNVRVTAQVAARLEAAPRNDIRQSRPDQKPYWHIERARVGNTRRVPVELVANGQVLARQEIEADGKLQDISFNVRIEKSAWLALRVLPSSHSNPIWVQVNQQPIREKASLEWCLEAVDVCRRSKLGLIRPSEVAEFHKAYDFAKAEYAKRLAEAK